MIDLDDARVWIGSEGLVVQTPEYRLEAGLVRRDGGRTDGDTLSTVLLGTQRPTRTHRLVLVGVARFAVHTKEPAPAVNVPPPRRPDLPGALDYLPDPGERCDECSSGGEGALSASVGGDDGDVETCDARCAPGYFACVSGTRFLTCRCCPAAQH